MTENERRFSASYDFDINEVANNMNDSENPNQEAWYHLNSSMCTPEFFANNLIRNGKYKNMLYPISLAETLEMERRLTLAEDSQNVKDETFSSILNEMKSIVAWSKKRHFNISTTVIISFFVFISFLGIVLPKGNTKELKATLSSIQAWDNKDTTYTPEETYYVKGDYFDRFTCPKIYKYYYLHEIGEKIRSNKADVEFSKKDSVKTKAAEELLVNLAEFERRNAISSKELKKQLINDYQSEIDNQDSITLHYRILYVLLLCLLPLYLISCYQYGFNISRFINFRESIHQLCTFGSAICAFGAGAATVVETTHYSDGSSQTERHSPGIIFVLLGIILMVYCSSFALLILTINGLYYNYFKNNSKEHADLNERRKISLFDNENIQKNSLQYFFNFFMNVIISNCMSLFNFRGRENRSSYAIFITANTLLLILLLWLDCNFYIVGILYYITILSSMVRRIHDIGYSGKLIAIMGIIPYAFLVIVGLTIILPGTKGDNNYGAAPDSNF